MPSGPSPWGSAIHVTRVSAIGLLANRASGGYGDGCEGGAVGEPRLGLRCTRARPGELGKDRVTVRTGELALALERDRHLEEPDGDAERDRGLADALA